MKREIGEHVSQMNKLCKELETLLLSYSNAEDVGIKFKDLEIKYQEFHNMNESLMITMTDEHSKGEFSKQYDSVTRNYEEMKTRIKQWFEDTEETKSQSSTSTTPTASSLRRLKLAQANLDHLKKQQTIERQAEEFKLKQAKELADMEFELKKASIENEYEENLSVVDDDAKTTVNQTKGDI